MCESLHVAVKTYIQFFYIYNVLERSAVNILGYACCLCYAYGTRLLRETLFCDKLAMRILLQRQACM